MSVRRTAGVATVVLFAYLSTGLVVIPQDEVGVVRRFGAALREPWPPGLHWGLPWGADRVDRISKDRARMVAVGSGTGSQAVRGADDFLTGDENLVTVETQIHYRIEDASRYLFGSRTAEEDLAALAQSALVRTLAARSVDDVLTKGRGEVADRVRRETQEGADAQGLGISIRAVYLLRVAPPATVALAFAEAARARGELRRDVADAEVYRARALADARGRSREVVDRAAARADALVQSARGEAARFARLLREVGSDPAGRRRMYLDTLAELLPKFARTYIVTPGHDVEIRVDAER